MIRFFRSPYVKLFLASFLALYFELVTIRYLSSEIRVFAYLKNLPLVASFFGLGLGMVLGRKEKLFTRLFPYVMLILFLLISLASTLGITHLPFPNTDYFIWGSMRDSSTSFVALLRYAGVITFISALVVFFCIALGRHIGEALENLPPLKGYAIDLLGSLAGIGVFTAWAYFATPPWVWLGAGSLLLLIFWKNIWERLVILTLPVVLLAASASALWSPYYRISLQADPALPGETSPAAIYLSVNHDYHQKILNLSDAFFAAHPQQEPNASARATYNLPYLMHPGAKQVLIVGAGTGNDVAAALRAGAEHVDAVEIDPVILDLGKKLHPEHPYNSERVTIFNDDARAFFQKATRQYDLIVFAYLDSHTLLANSSSLRLDNFVYTRESITEAKQLLASQGTLVVAFADRFKTFVSARLYKIVKDAFGASPTAYFSPYDGGGIVLVAGEGVGKDTRYLGVRIPGIFSDNLPQIGPELDRLGKNIEPATDRWPFLYLRNRTIPAAYTIVFILSFAAWILSKRALALERIWTRSHLHFFMLGAGFLLLETKAITELSLLFGSTWMVNTLAIMSFLGMAIAANLFLMCYVPPRKALYTLLFVSLGVSIFFPLGHLAGFSPIVKVLVAGAVLALPVFFSGMLFSRAFRETQEPSKALGVNLLGALVGGVAENTVMIGGTLLLGALAVLFYVISAMAVIEFRK